MTEILTGGLRPLRAIGPERTYREPGYHTAPKPEAAIPPDDDAEPLDGSRHDRMDVTRGS